MYVHLVGAPDPSTPTQRHAAWHNAGAPRHRLTPISLSTHHRRTTYSSITHIDTQEQSARLCTDASVKKCNTQTITRKKKNKLFHSLVLYHTNSSAIPH